MLQKKTPHIMNYLIYKKKKETSLQIFLEKLTNYFNFSQNIVLMNIFQKTMLIIRTRITFLVLTFLIKMIGNNFLIVKQFI